MELERERDSYDLCTMFSCTNIVTILATIINAYTQERRAILYDCQSWLIECLYADFVFS